MSSTEDWKERWKARQEEKERLASLLLDQHQIAVADYTGVVHAAAREAAHDKVDARMVDNGIGPYEYWGIPGVHEDWGLELEGAGQFDVVCTSMDFEGPEEDTTVPFMLCTPRPKARHEGEVIDHEVEILCSLISYAVARRVVRVKDGDEERPLVVWDHTAHYEWVVKTH